MFNNDRIQLFPFGQRNEITIAGNGSQRWTSLHGPMDVKFDADGSIFIIEYNTHRIIRLSLEKDCCIAACTDVSGFAVNQLLRPGTLNFDSQGNLFVINGGSRRIQRFQMTCNTSPPGKSTRTKFIHLLCSFFLSRIM